MRNRVFCDTQALVFWALDRSRLSPAALRAIKAAEQGTLACADISLWEIAMLCAKGRIGAPLGRGELLWDIVTALRLDVVAINPEIAVLAQAPCFQHGDPADRLIGATALHYHAPLITSDAKLRVVPELETIW
jgi:PIN domain nuclease of toxin-antitoxin system